MYLNRRVFVMMLLVREDLPSSRNFMIWLWTICSMTLEEIDVKGTGLQLEGLLIPFLEQWCDKCTFPVIRRLSLVVRSLVDES